MKATFTGSSIASPEALARALRIDLQDLRTIAGSASTRYSDFPVAKKDGSSRQVSGPKHELKILQKRINRQLFERVDYPHYLYGGIRGRDYVQNAAAHSGAELVVALDVKNFYPNIKRQMVLDLFRYFFNFPAAVAEILTDLSTKDGLVPQGACTSSYVANLIFWQYEPRLVSQLADQGLIYTRLIDDITISSTKPLAQKRVEGIVKNVTAMLGLGGFKLKKRKTRITAASNPESLMEVTGLWLNRGKPRVQRLERVDIRSEVRRCCAVANFDRISEEYHALHDRVSGRVAKLSQLNHHEAVRYRKDLSVILPVYGLRDVRKTRGLVAGLKKSPLKSRDNLSYILKYHSIVHRVNILARTHPALASDLRGELVKFVPTKTKDEVIHG